MSRRCTEAARLQLMEALETLAAQLAICGSVEAALGCLPRDERQILSPAPAARATGRDPVHKGLWHREPEALTLARIAVAAGVDDPEQGAIGLAQLLSDLQESGA